MNYAFSCGFSVTSATPGDVADAGCRWSQVAAAAGWAVNTRIHASGDGAPRLAA